MKILVTGATGFVGKILVPRLVAQGHSVRTMGRASLPPSAFDGLAIEHCRGDVTNPEHVRAAVKGQEVVFHMAGLVSYRKKDIPRQYAVNVVGTRNVMQSAFQAGVSRVIHTSSVAAFGIPKPGEIGTEDIEYNLADLGLSYCDTKHQAEEEVLKFHKLGLNAVILNPGIIFGEGDTHSHHHAIFAAMSKGWLLGVPPGGVTFSDINDVVDAHVNAIERGNAGQRYALVSANLSYLDAAKVFAKVSGTHTAVFKIYGPLLVRAGLFAEEVFPLLGMKPPLTRQAAWLSQHMIFFSSDKACAELDFKPTPFESTVRRTANYYLGNQNK